MGRLENKVAIVTGAGHGIGAGIVSRFAAEGASVIVADINEESAESIAPSLQDLGFRASAYTVDVSSGEEIAGLVDACVSRYGGVDIVVNNAAVTNFGRGVEAEDFEARYDKLMATNVKSIWMMMHHAAPHLRARGGGSVINIASVHALASVRENSAYAASKGALVAGTRAFAVELAPDRIRINCISPGRIYTSPMEEHLKKQLGPELYQEFQALFGDWQRQGRELAQPLPVEGLPEDIALCAVYLASDESRFCTGANFIIDGGMTAQLADSGYVSDATRRHQARFPEVRAWIDEAKQRPLGRED